MSRLTAKRIVFWHDPAGEYAMSCLGRERMFEYGARTRGTKCAILRLNYAVEMRYGVLLDIGTKVFERRPVDLGMGLVNIIWQGDANSVCLRSFAHCAAPPLTLNLTGPETLAVRYLANEFGRRFGIEPLLDGRESETALLNNASRCQELFGYPTVPVAQMVDWVADWIQTLGGLATCFRAAASARTESTRDSRITFLFAGVFRQSTVRPTRLMIASAPAR